MKISPFPLNTSMDSDLIYAAISRETVLQQTSAYSGSKNFSTFSSALFSDRCRSCDTDGQTESGLSRICSSVHCVQLWVSTRV